MKLFIHLFSKTPPKDLPFKKIVSITLLFSCIVFAQHSFAQANQQHFTPKDFSHWLNAAYIAEAIYQSPADITDAFDNQGYKVILQQQIEGYSVGFVLATNHDSKQHILAVRGTSNVENIIVNAAFVLVLDKLSGIDIHQGFLLSARDIFQQVQGKINPQYKINTIGHSLGGAAALILAMMLDAQGYDVGEVVTFGQPKVTNISGSRKFRHLDIKRLVTAKDIVPLVPPVDPIDLMKLSIFWHQGTEIVLFENNQYSVLMGVDSMMRATDFFNDIPGAQHLKHHFMTTYIKHLQAKLKTSIEVEYKSDFKFSDWFGSSSITSQ
jgi:predicted lipase